uniref:Uncharacterized protein n=1 Tax=Romanomermis culicivorax TaxID=13658 RepID=A0A915L7H0_ROMCU
MHGGVFPSFPLRYGTESNYNQTLNSKNRSPIVIPKINNPTLAAEPKKYRFQCRRKKIHLPFGALEYEIIFQKKLGLQSRLRFLKEQK